MFIDFVCWSEENEISHSAEDKIVLYSVVIVCSTI